MDHERKAKRPRIEAPNSRAAVIITQCLSPYLIPDLAAVVLDYYGSGFRGHRTTTLSLDRQLHHLTAGDDGLLYGLDSNVVYSICPTTGRTSAVTGISASSVVVANGRFFFQKKWDFIWVVAPEKKGYQPLTFPQGHVEPECMTADASARELLVCGSVGRGAGRSTWVYVFSTTTLTLIRTLPEPLPYHYASVRHMAVDGNDTILYSHTNTSRLCVLDRVSGRSLRELTLGGTAIQGIMPLGHDELAILRYEEYRSPGLDQTIQYMKLMVLVRWELAQRADMQVRHATDLCYDGERMYALVTSQESPLLMVLE